MATVKIRQTRQVQSPGSNANVIEERVIVHDTAFPLPGFSYVCADQEVVPFAWRTVDPEVIIDPEETE